MNQHDGSIAHGRKGVAYDWQSLYAAAQAADLDRQWAELAATVADRS
ncbi:MAG: hypothetical protein JWM12_275 [Ilumatobacteraceae bacterium]|jgi:hypothetical protein|nr:hypothetical protein [Ilumatobacteraceae bacterium]